MRKYIVYYIIITVFTIVLVGCIGESENIQESLEIKKEITDGDFIYRLVTEKAEYTENGPIKMYAELEYIGDKEEIEIFHAASPFYFPMVEKARDYQIGYAMNQPLLSTLIIKGVPFKEDYAGAGAYNSEDEENYVNFMKGIINNEFPVGQYVVNGAAVFFLITDEATNEKREYNIEAQIKFEVN